MEIQHKNMIQQQQNKESASSNPSSPSHEFSFTISLLSSSTTNMAKTQQPPLAIDLTPADDIFLHGHLLPLHILPNLATSPRLSTNSLDSFTLPIRELLANQDRPHNINSCICSNCDRRPKRHSFNSYEYNTRRNFWVDHTNMNEEEEFPTKERVKSKSFSLFGRPRKPKQGESKCEDQDEKMNKKKLITHFLKKYTSLFSKGRIRSEEIQIKKQPYSFSGKLTPRELSPMGIPNSGSDSTMEELQAAVQAAIAHCKNSIAVP